MVYIAEAHVMSEWPLRSAKCSATGCPIVVDEQPRTISDRLHLAQRFCEDYGIPADIEVLLDNPEKDDPFGAAYAPWPLRLYLIRNGVMEWIALPKDCGYDAAVAELLTMLDAEQR